MTSPRWLLAIGMLLGGIASAPAERPLRIAAASNLHVVTPALAEAWAADHPDIPLAFSHAATGSLVAQIHHGAPFDVLLAADLDYPQGLIDTGAASHPAPILYAHGQLVLWPAPPVGTKPADHLRTAKLRHLTLAQPRIAPYGQAALDWLEAQGLAEPLTDKLVYGENVAQALQLADSGHADACLVAASLLVPQADSDQGHLLVLPNDTLPHGAVALTRSRQPKTAQDFVAWLQSETARNIFAAHGYRLP